MEMHQVGYFLAAAVERSVTMAAEKCDVSASELTRGIKQLEEELGGNLFRCERSLLQLTELGELMQRRMKQMYDGAVAARLLASSVKSGEVGLLKLALSHSVTFGLLTPFICELNRLFSCLEPKILRGSAAGVLELVRTGQAELAVASDIEERSECVDRWPLFEERLYFALHGRHRLASQMSVDIGDLRGTPILQSRCCEHHNRIKVLLSSNNLDTLDCDIDSQHDLILLVEAGLGAAIIPGSTSLPGTLVRTMVDGIELRRTIYVYGLAGRPRSAGASAILMMVRAADWSRYEH